MACCSSGCCRRSCWARWPGPSPTGSTGARRWSITDVFRFALFASIPIVDNLVWLFVAQFLIEAFSLFWIPAKDAAVPNMLRKDQLEPANQLSLVTTYGLTPVLAAIVFAVLTSVGGQVRAGARPSTRSTSRCT